MRRLLLALLICGGLSGPAEAQTPVMAGAPFQLIADKNAASESVTVYRCFVGATIATLALFQSADPTTQPGTTITCTHPGLPAGTFVAAVAAVNAFGESPRSTADGVAGTVPSAPQNFRLEGTVIITGTLTVRP